MLVKVKYEVEFEAGRHKHPGHYVVVDGPDGSGKGPILEALLAEAKAHGLTRVLDCDVFEEEHETLPDFDIMSIPKKRGKGERQNPVYRELDDIDIVLMSEPNFCMGATREEVIRNFSPEVLERNPDRKYWAREAAEHYSSERRVKLARVALPALRRGKLVLSSRSITATPGHQVVQARLDGDDLTQDDIYSLSGNMFAAQNLPNRLIIPTGVGAEELMERIRGRKKKDFCTFERKDMQEALIERYGSEEYRKFFAMSGVEIHDIDTGKSEAYTREQAHRLFVYHILPNLRWDLLELPKPTL